MKLDRDTLLKRSEGLTLKPGIGSELTVVSGRGRAIHLVRFGLAILECFSEPRTLSQALSLISTQGKKDWVDLTSSILNLTNQGILVRHDLVKQTLVEGHSFHGLAVHARMLMDRNRTQSFIQAIKERIRPNDVVVDIGTGTGILAMAAARAGAGHIYAIESGNAALAADRLFKANGYQNKISLIREWSPKVTLPEKCDLLVSETIGNEPLGEGILETIIDAKSRFLKPDASMIPMGLRVSAIPVEIPLNILENRCFFAENVKKLESYYDFDFKPLLDMPADGSFAWSAPKLRKWPRLAEPITLFDIDFTNLGGSTLRVEHQVVCVRNGLCSGLAVYFDSVLSGGASITSNPDRVDESCSWANQVWRFSPFEVHVGTKLKIVYTYGLGKKRVEVTALPSG